MGRTDHETSTGNLGLCATFLAAVPVGAHTAKQSDPVKASPRRAIACRRAYHLELVAKDGELVLYVADHSDKAIPTDGVKAKATIQHGYEKAKIQVELEPSGENTLKGTGNLRFIADTGIIVFLRLPEHEAYAARFTPRDTKDGAAQRGGHHHPPKH